jgi:predicted MFS family arabinose efflux permease
MLALACASYFCFGAIMSSIAPLITPILADLNISYSRIGVILVALGIMLAVILFQRRKTA